jgi:hypothetical protein
MMPKHAAASNSAASSPETAAGTATASPEIAKVFRGFTYSTGARGGALYGGRRILSCIAASALR